MSKEMSSWARIVAPKGADTKKKQNLVDIGSNTIELISKLSFTIVNDNVDEFLATVIQELKAKSTSVSVRSKGITATFESELGNSIFTNVSANIHAWKIIFSKFSELKFGSREFEEINRRGGIKLPILSFNTLREAIDAGLKCLVFHVRSLDDYRFMKKHLDRLNGKVVKVVFDTKNHFRPDEKIHPDTGIIQLPKGATHCVKSGIDEDNTTFVN